MDSSFRSDKAVLGKLMNDHNRVVSQVQQPIDQISMPYHTDLVFDNVQLVQRDPIEENM